MTEEELKAFLCFLSDGARLTAGLLPLDAGDEGDWIAIPQQPKGGDGKPAPKRPDLPYITALLMDSWQISITHEVGNGEGMTAQMGSLYSVQFHGDGALRVAPLFNIWCRSYQAHLADSYLFPTRNPQNLGEYTLNADGITYTPSAGTAFRYRQCFYLRESSQHKNVSTLVNGIWEERAVINMKLEHRAQMRITVPMTAGYGAEDHYETANITVSQDPLGDVAVEVDAS